MHILLIPSWYPTPSNPVSGIFFQEQALALKQAGHTVGVVVPPLLRSKRRLLAVRSIAGLKSETTLSVEDNVPVYRGMIWRWYPGRMERANAGLQVGHACSMIDSYCDRFGRPDILHAHSALLGGVVAAKTHECKHIPAVLTEHSSAYQRNMIHPWQTPLISQALNGVNRVFAVGDTLAEHMQVYAPGVPIRRMDNQVNETIFQFTSPPDARIPFRLAGVGTLTPNKGFDILIQAVAVASASLDIHLEIGGAGTEHDRLKKLAQQLGMQDCIQFNGRLTRNEVRDLFVRSHVAVSASHVETFGISLIEAMACGRPVIATRSGGPESQITAENGLLVPTNDHGALAKAIMNMAETYHTYDYQSISDNCILQFGTKATTSKLTALYEDVVTTVGVHAE